MAHSDPRKAIKLTPEEFDLIDRAAYWEGFPSPSRFVAQVMRRYIDVRSRERGAPYGPARWRRRMGADDEEDAE